MVLAFSGVIKIINSKMAIRFIIIKIEDILFKKNVVHTLFIMKKNLNKNPVQPVYETIGKLI